MTAFLEGFVRALRAQDRSPHTVSAYESDVRGFFNWLTEQLGETVPPVEVTAFDVQRYRDHLNELGRKPSTVNRKLAALRVFFDWATQQEHASTNPAEDVNGVDQERRPPKALNEQQVYRLQREVAAQCQLAEAQFDDPMAPTVVTAYRDAALLNLLLYAGLRVSEAAALKLADVDLGERKGKVIVRSEKGRKYREVPLHKTARQALTAYLEKCPSLADKDYVFQGQRGPLGARYAVAHRGVGGVCRYQERDPACLASHLRDTLVAGSRNRLGDGLGVIGARQRGNDGDLHAAQRAGYDGGDQRSFVRLTGMTVPGV